MEDIEVPTEHLHEKIQEEAEEHKENWSFYVALSTALMAVFAAVSSLIGSDHANEALILQIKASDQWAYYQAKSIKSEIAAATDKIITVGKTAGVANNAAVQKYEQEKELIKKKAEDYEQDADHHLSRHRILARSVTFLQIAIAISAISILAKRRFLWIVSMIIAVGGILFFIQGILM